MQGKNVLVPTQGSGAFRRKKIPVCRTSTLTSSSFRFRSPLSLTDYLLAVIPAIALLMMTTYTLVIAFSRSSRTLRTDARICICVAARNEEKKIMKTLRSLAALNYPVENLEIHIGDDDSDDRTAEIVKEFIQDKPHFHYHHITEKLEGIKGKQNVLAQLFRKANGDFLLVTDADITVHPDWAAGLIGAFEPGVGMVSGTTIVAGKGFLTKMQNLDWTFGSAVNKAHEAMGIPLTGSGNNMAITREAYNYVGGYESVPFSITEDYKLFKEMCEKGPYEFRCLFHPSTLCLSEPVDDFPTLIRQRRRWFKGGAEIVWYNQLFFLLNVLVVPFLITMAFLSPWQWFVGFMSAKVAMDLVFLTVSTARLKKLKWLVFFPFYEIYYQLSTLVLPFTSRLGKKVVWKGRTYDS